MSNSVGNCARSWSIVLGAVFALSACGGGGTIDEAAPTTTTVADAPTTTVATPTTTTAPPDDTVEVGDLPDVATVNSGAAVVEASSQLLGREGHPVNLVDGSPEFGWWADGPTATITVGLLDHDIAAIGIDTTRHDEEESPLASARTVVVESALVDPGTGHADAVWEPVGTIEAAPGEVTLIETPGLAANALRLTATNGGSGPLRIDELLVHAEPVEANLLVEALDEHSPIGIDLEDRWILELVDGAIVGCAASGDTIALEAVGPALVGTVSTGDKTAGVVLSLQGTAVNIIFGVDDPPFALLGRLRTAIETGCDVGDFGGDTPADDEVTVSETSPTEQRAPDPLLVIAAARNDLAEVELQLAEGADPNIARDSDGWTPLLFAAQEGGTEVAQALLAAGALPDRANDDGWTPLMIAAQNGHAGVVDALLDQGANPRVGRSTNWTALHSAVFKNQVQIVDRLLDTNISREAAEDGYTALTLAAQEGADAIITLLLDEGVAIDGSVDGPSPVFMASQNGHASALQLLLGAGADADDGGANEPPVVIAATRGHTEVVVLLADGGADLDQPRADGVTALHWAAYDDLVEMAALLVELGADLSVVDDDGRTALDIAVERDNDSVAAVLRAAD